MVDREIENDRNWIEEEEEEEEEKLLITVEKRERVCIYVEKKRILECEDCVACVNYYIININ